MCARMKVSGQTLRPGNFVMIKTAQGAQRLKWGGTNVPFARAETLSEKWLSRGWQKGTVPVTQFAEKNHTTNELVWSPERERQVVVVYQGNEFAVVTRAATSREAAYYGHNRIPMVEVTSERQSV